MEDDHKEELRAQLEKWGKEIKELKNLAGKNGTETQIIIFKQIEDLRMKEKAVREELEKYRQKEEDAWQEAKNDAGRIWENVKTTVQETQNAFKEGLKNSKEKPK